jgi:hypothetical protein
MNMHKRGVFIMYNMGIRCDELLLRFAAFVLALHLVHLTGVEMLL